MKLPGLFLVDLGQPARFAGPFILETYYIKNELVQDFYPMANLLYL